MARNWKLSEVREIMADLAKVQDCGRRLPLAMHYIGQLNEAGMKLLETMPDYMTIRKIETSLKENVGELEDEEEEEVKAAPKKEKPAAKPAPKAKKKPEPEEDDRETGFWPAKLATGGVQRERHAGAGNARGRA